MKTLIVGGGASGLMAAALLPGSLVLERTGDVGRKLLATGGGRCNFTHEGKVSELCKQFVGAERFVRPALEFFPSDKQQAWFEEHGVPSKVEKDGCVFPQDDKAESVRSALRAAVKAAGSEIRCNTQVAKLLLEGERVVGVETTGGEQHFAENIILAAGGASRPSLGTDGSIFELLKAVGVEVVEPLPGMGALKLGGECFADFAGLTFPNAELHLAKGVRKDGTPIKVRISTGGLLLTGSALSGPCALNICGEVAERLTLSSPVELRICWRGDMSTPELWYEFLCAARETAGASFIRNVLAPQYLPRTFAGWLCVKAGMDYDATLARATRKQLLALSELCARFPVRIDCTDDFSQSMASVGGVSRTALSQHSMALKRYPNVYAVGEVVDVLGNCGGYNLAWAWASSALAARSILGRLSL